MASCLLVLSVLADVHAAGRRSCESDAVCGPRCLLAVCQRYGVAASLEELSSACGIDATGAGSRGTSLLALANAALARGLHTAALKIAVAELAGVKCPAIAHTWSSHFVVVEGWGDGSPLVTDPPAAAHRMARDEFQKVYSGFALLISKDKADFPEPKAEGADPRLGGGTPGTSGLTSRGGGSVTASRAGTRGTRSWSFRRWRRPAAA